MSIAVRGIRKSAAVLAAVAVMSAGAFAAGDTVNVRFKVNVAATVTAVQGEDTASMTVAANETKAMRLPPEIKGSTSVRNTGGAPSVSNAPTITGSRGNITLRLPTQTYRNAEIALYSVNGKRILRGKAAASQTANAISRKNVAAGVYILSVTGINGSVFTSRFTHSGGNMNINAAFGAESASRSPAARQLGKKADDGGDGDLNYIWEITVSAAAADEYYDSTYRIDILELLGFDIIPVQNINLKQVPPPPPPPPVITTFIDGRDGKEYKKVTIGAQTWMAENLNYRGNDVDNPLGICYNNRADSCAKYGRLYNWVTAMGMNDEYYGSSYFNYSEYVQGVCPVGWHLPSAAEWTSLTNYVGINAGTKLKSSTGWSSYQEGPPVGTNEYGFSALPGGSGDGDGSFAGGGSWWSATQFGPDWPVGATRIYMSGETVESSSTTFKKYQCSVRCVADIKYNITFDANEGTVSPTSDSTWSVGYLASLPTPTRSGYIFKGWFTTKTSNTQVTLSTRFSANTTIYAQWIAPPIVTTFTDSRDGKPYNKVTIGNQTWMAENLNYDVPGVETDVCYLNSPDSCAKYGRLYNWVTARVACPSGWHLPSEAEWTQLLDFVGGLNAGTKLKSTSGWNWNDYYGISGNGTDEYGFSALPGGSGWGGSFYNAGYNGYWWSATDYFNIAAYSLQMTRNEASQEGKYEQVNLLSVRCVQD